MIGKQIEYSKEQSQGRPRYATTNIVERCTFKLVFLYMGNAC